MSKKNDDELKDIMESVPEEDTSDSTMKGMEIVVYVLAAGLLCIITLVILLN